MRKSVMIYLLMAFETARDRDAWSTIRGYIYQVELTILRWLDLTSDQVLELERGEDIDLVSLLAPSDPKEQKRTLEQIKHLNQNITLKSPSVVASITNFIEHKTQNPSLDLYFRYTTNADIGKERLSPLPNKEPGIQVWERIRKIHIDTESKQVAVKGLRSILTHTACPEDLNEQTWHLFQDFIKTASDADFEDLVLRFQISTKNESHESLNDEIKNTLIKKENATDLGQATHQYQHLMIYVLKVLSTKGVKSLTANQLIEQLKLPTLPEEDKLLLQRFASQLAHLELVTQENSQAISVLTAKVEMLAKQQGIDIAVAYTHLTPDIDLPSNVQHLSQRIKVTQAYAHVAISHTWTALQGGMGLGKTQLAILIAKYLGNFAVWINLAQRSDNEACFQFDRSLALATNTGFEIEAVQRYLAVCEQLSNKLVILDDLPNLLRTPELTEHLLRFIEAANHFNVHIVSTSYHEVPQQVRARANHYGFQTLNVPFFTEEETKELLLAYGASQEPLRYATFLTNISSGHPLVLNVAITYLREQNWRVNTSELESFLKGDYKYQLNEETIARLVNTVADEQSRELLSRLDIILGRFTLQEVQAVAASAKAISRPREKLSNLLGLWVQRESDNHYRISPLVNGILQSELPSEIQKSINLKLAEEILSKRTIDQYKANDAFLYLHRAGEIKRAAVVLMMSLNELLRHDSLSYDGLLLAIWTSEPLPLEIDLATRIFIRSLQIANLHKRNKAVNFLINDLGVLIDQTTAYEAWSILSVCSQAIFAIADYDFGLATKAIRMSLNNLADGLMIRPDGVSEQLRMPEGHHIEHIIWLITTETNTPEKAQMWLEMISSLSDDQLRHAFSDSMAQNGIMLIVNNLWTRESDKKESERNWQKVLQILQKFAAVAKERQLVFLWANTIRSQIVVIAEYLKDLPRAHDIAEEALKELVEYPTERFLIEECLGRQYVYKSENSKAIEWLERAIQNNVPEFHHEHSDALQALSAAYSSSDKVKAVNNAKFAIDRLQQMVEVPAVSEVKGFGELAIAFWIAGDMKQAFFAMESAFKVLLKIKDNSDTWKALFGVLGHVLGYLSSIASTGSPPDIILNRENYAPPVPRFFYTYSPKLSELYSEERFGFIFALLSNFAEAIEDHKKATEWAVMGFDIAKKNSQSLLISRLSRDVIPSLILDSQYDVALEVAFEAGAISKAEMILHARGEDILNNSISPESILGAKSKSSIWEQAEDITIGLVHLPILFHLVSLRLDDPSQAGEKALVVARFYREVMVNSVLPDFWHSASEIIQKAFEGKVTGELLLHRAKDRSDLGDEGYLQVTAYMLASVQSDIQPEQSIHIHAASIQYINDRLNGYSPLALKQIALSFLQNYWLKTLKKQRFRFRSPDLYEQQLQSVSELPSEKKGKAIVKIVGSSLGARFHNSVREWLNS